MNDIPKQVIPLVEPTLSGAFPPSCHLVLLEPSEDAARFLEGCQKAGMLMRNIGDKVLLLLSYDSSEHTKECLRGHGQPQHPVGLIELGAYDALHPIPEKV